MDFLRFHWTKHLWGGRKFNHSERVIWAHEHIRIKIKSLRLCNVLNGKSIHVNKSTFFKGSRGRIKVSVCGSLKVRIPMVKVSNAGTVHRNFQNLTPRQLIFAICVIRERIYMQTIKTMGICRELTLEFFSYFCYVFRINLIADLTRMF